MMMMTNFHSKHKNIIHQNGDDLNDWSGTAIELVKTGTGTLSQYIISDPVTVIANFCTLTGFSLRNVKGLFGFKKFGEKFKEKFPNGLETEEQETILSDCFIELEDYIKNSANFDDNVFEKIGALLIHGLENEDLLTREYIRILKQLTWIELQIFFRITWCRTYRKFSIIS